MDRDWRRALRLGLLSILGLALPASSAVVEAVPGAGIAPLYGAYAAPALTPALTPTLTPVSALTAATTLAPLAAPAAALAAAPTASQAVAARALSPAHFAAAPSVASRATHANASDTPSGPPRAAQAAAQAAVSGEAFDGAKAPAARRDDAVVDDFFGTKVADPYRWMEDPNSNETKAWVQAQGAFAHATLSRLPGREAIAERLQSLSNHERIGLPTKKGKLWIFSRHSGLQDQNVLYKSKTLNGKAEILLDPNAFSADGTVALAETAFSPDGKLLAYKLARDGSDLGQWRVRDVETGKDLLDVVNWATPGKAVWAADGSGFYYTRYPTPQPGEEYTAVKRNSNVYFHRLGAPQGRDELTLGHSLAGGRYLMAYQYEGEKKIYRYFVKDLRKKDAPFLPLYAGFSGEDTIVDVRDGVFYVQTTNGAPRGRLVAVDAADPRKFREVISQPPRREVLERVVALKNGYAAVVMQDAFHRLMFFDRNGAFKSEARIPHPGTVMGIVSDGKSGVYIQYSSYNHPNTIFHVDDKTGRLRAFRRPKVDFDPKKMELKQVFYPSKDGTLIPMFIVYKKGLRPDGNNPTYLYGYGGFDVSLTPTFSAEIASWIEMGGVYAVANLRGGGEYGKEWHEAGILKNKQNVFDDFIAAGEFLIRANVTSASKLAIGGGSNGGLLVGAAMTQRPDLFGAAIPEVGVHDLLRYQRFTVGANWSADYGAADTKEGFETLIKYSPLHNVKPGTAYPPTLVMTADHDDRVVPAHSEKFAAALQAAQAGSAPILLRVESHAGHGGGMPLSKAIEQSADKWAFLKKFLGMN